jgi:uncharacterized coiled-coil protein SlyX
MSIKTRLQSLEKRLAKKEPEETVVRITEVIVHSREEVDQLREAGLLDSSRENSRPPTRGRVRVVVDGVVDAKDLLAPTPSTNDEGLKRPEGSES